MSRIPEFDARAFGDAIRAFRKSRRLSLEGAARRNGVLRETIWHVEKRAKRPTIHTVVLAAWIGRDPREFLKAPEDKQS